MFLKSIIKYRKIMFIPTTKYKYVRFETIGNIHASKILTIMTDLFIKASMLINYVK